MKKLVMILFSCILIVSLAACNSSENEVDQASQEAVNMEMEYNLETKEFSPIMMQYGTSESLEAYTFAAEHPEVLDYMPCYCGCYEDDGHTNNTACFIDSVAGNIAKLDSMGLG